MYKDVLLITVSFILQIQLIDGAWIHVIVLLIYLVIMILKLVSRNALIINLMRMQSILIDIVLNYARMI